MANMVNSFKFANKQLDIGVSQFTNMINNDVLTLAKDLQNSILGFNLGSLGTLGSLTGQISSMMDMITNLPGRVLDNIKQSIDRTINGLLNMPISIYGGTVLATLREMDDIGVKTFLRESIDIGNMRYCNNLDLIQSAFEGVTLPESILDGILLGLSLNWLDRMCKGITPETERQMTNKQRMEVSHPYAGTPVNRDTLMDDFGSLMSAYNYYSTPIPEIEYEQDDLFVILQEGKLKDFHDKYLSITTPTFKKNLLTDIETYKKLTKKNGVNYPQYLEDRGMVRAMPVYGQEHVVKSSNLPRAKDALGSYIKNLKDVQVVGFNPYGNSEFENGILAKLGVVQALAWKPEYLSKTHASGQFQNTDFDSLQSIFTKEELAYFDRKPRSPYAWRFNGLPIVTEMFITDERPHNKKKGHINPDPTHTPLDAKKAPPKIIVS